jgi:hypothetical protein
MSMLRLAKTPIVALPGDGFYATEQDVDGEEFNWLSNQALIDIHSASARTRLVWLHFELGSIDFAREVELSGGGRTYTVTAPPRGAVGAMRVGPFPLLAGQGTVFVSSTRPPRRYGSDPRRLSVRVGALQAAAAGERTP